MPQKMNGLLQTYISEIKKIYGTHLSKIILYGSYARGDFRPDSDVDIMILLDLSDLDLKKYSKELSYMTYDFNLDRCYLSYGTYHPRVGRGSLAAFYRQDRTDSACFLGL